MDLLIDTHVLLWWDDGGGSRGPAGRNVIADRKNRIHVSAASIWEIAIKSAKGKLLFTGSPAAAIEKNEFLPLSLSPEDAEVAGSLDWFHPDPFDRMLVAQAKNHGMTLLHADDAIHGFKGVSQLWAR